MHGRSLLIAAAALTYAASSSAEPTKPDAREVNPSANRPAAVVLASVDEVRAPVPANTGQAATPAKRPRVGRVTTCRCADQMQH
jgi:hypothetical protein